MGDGKKMFFKITISNMKNNFVGFPRAENSGGSREFHRMM